MQNQLFEVGKAEGYLLEEVEGEIEFLGFVGDGRRNL